MQAQNVDGGQAGKSSPAGGKRKALRIIEPSAQGPSHAYSPVVGGAAAHSDDDATISPIQSALDELAGAVGGGVTGVSVLVGKERQPRRLGHLYNGSLAVAHDSPASLHALAQWAVYSAGEGLVPTWPQPGRPGCRLLRRPRGPGLSPPWERREESLPEWLGQPPARTRFP